MTLNNIIKKLKTIEDKNYGEILNVNNNIITFIDYSLDTTMEIRPDSELTDDYIKSIIHISNNLNQFNITPEYIITIMKTAFKTEYYDVIRTLSGIIIPSNETEYNNMLNACCRTNDNLHEWYDYDDEYNYNGHAYTAHQIVFINHTNILKLAKQISDENHSTKYEYEIGFLTTLIHELQHIHLECNPTQNIDDNMKQEISVENFALSAYESLPHELRHFPTP